MKWPQDQVEIVERAFHQLFNSWGEDQQTYLLEFDDELRLSQVKYFYTRVVSFQLRNDNTHPYFRKNKRLVSHNPDYQLYPNGCNDDHWKTLMKHIAQIKTLSRLMEKEYHGISS